MQFLRKYNIQEGFNESGVITEDANVFLPYSPAIRSKCKQILKVNGTWLGKV